LICTCGKSTTHGVYEGGTSKKYCKVACLVSDWNKHNSWKINEQEVHVMAWGNDNGYKPEKNESKGEFKPLKGDFNFFVNDATVGLYEGDYEDYKGKTFIKYEIQVANGQGFDGRKIWKTVDVADEKVNKQGKTKLEQFRDTMFTLGLDCDFKGEETLLPVLAKFKELNLRVNTYHFKGDEDKTVQMHKIIGIAEGDLEGQSSSEEIPF